MRYALTLSLGALLLTAGPADAGFQEKGYIPGSMPESPNLPSPPVMEMNGDFLSPEVVVVNPHDGQMEVGMVELGSSQISWIHVMNWPEPPDRIYYLDVDNDGLLDAIISATCGVLIVGWSDGASALEPDAGGAVRLSATVRSNPAHDQCQVAFSNSRSGPVSVVLFDSSGRRIREILSGSMPPGFYNPTWDGRDDSGTEVSSGVYFAKITTSEGEQTAKVVLTR
jgi:hypothetical protein